MTPLKLTADPETFEDRQGAAANTLAELAKWEHCTHDEASHSTNFSDAVERFIGRGHAPTFVWSDYHDEPASYAWQVFCQTVSDAITMDRGEVADALADAERRLENGVGKPSASDGSKGQWRSSLSARINTYQWLLEGEAND